MFRLYPQTSEKGLAFEQLESPLPPCFFGQQENFILNILDKSRINSGLLTQV